MRQHPQKSLIFVRHPPHLPASLLHLFQSKFIIYGVAVLKNQRFFRGYFVSESLFSVFLNYFFTK